MHERIRPRTDVFFPALVSTLSLHSYGKVWPEHFEKSCKIPGHEANAQVNGLLLIPSKGLFTNCVDNFWDIFDHILVYSFECLIYKNSNHT